MIITTTHTIEGKQIGEYLGLVTGETIIKVKVSRCSLVGLTEAREDSIEKMQAEAQRQDAHAVVGINIDYQGFGPDNFWLMVTATGTAVKLQENR